MTFPVLYKIISSPRNSILIASKRPSDENIANSAKRWVRKSDARRYSQ